MALESFGKQTASAIDHAAQLCHDLLRDNDNITGEIEFAAGQQGIWRVEPGTLDDEPCVVIKIGVG